MTHRSEKARFIWKKSCDSCRRFKKVLDGWGIAYDGREMNGQPLSADDIDGLIGERTVQPFLNTRNAVYRELALGKNPPGRARAVRLIAETNNLLRRPILVLGDELVIGTDTERVKALFGITE